MLRLENFRATPRHDKTGRSLPIPRAWGVARPKHPAQTFARFAEAGSVPETASLAARLRPAERRYPSAIADPHSATIRCLAVEMSASAGCPVAMAATRLPMFVSYDACH